MRPDITRSLLTTPPDAGPALYCEHCPTVGRCVVCGSFCTEDGTGDERPTDTAARIRALRAHIAALEDELARERVALASLLVLAGRRPGDGTDQPRLFEADAQVRLF